MTDTMLHRPETPADAEAILQRDADAMLIAGGQDLVPRLRRRRESCGCFVSVGAIEALHGISLSDSLLTIGAAETHAAIGASKTVQSAYPALAKLASEIGDVQIRNRGTLGGALAADPWRSDYHPALLAAGAVFKTNRRVIAADEFYAAQETPVFVHGEMLISVALPSTLNSVWIKHPKVEAGYAALAVCAARLQAGMRIAMIAEATPPMRLPAIEEIFGATITGGKLLDDEALSEAIEAAPLTDYQQAVLRDGLDTVIAEFAP